MAEVKAKVMPKFDPGGEKPIFTWVAPEFIKYKKTTGWFVAVFIVGIILGIIFAMQGQWSGVALVIAAILVFTTLSSAKPKKISSALYQEGVVTDGKVFSFGQFKSFWIELGDLPKVKLQLLGRLAGQVSLPLFEIDPEQIRLFIGKHLPEENRGPDIVDQINKFMRF
ncbi:MAG: hypothetical protein M1324_02530 [Patescibacteria group bacterium]|nr:hypothetical protein [Patescibacteria group bacterium]